MSHGRIRHLTVTCLAASLFLVSLVPGCNPTTVAPDTVRVTRVIDGDTIIISGGDRVRYIGIDAPELGEEPEPFANEAAQANRELVEGKTVRLERDVSDTDRFGRLLRYAWVNGTMVNAELVRRGLAEANQYPPDTRYQPLLEAAEVEARLAGRGMWAK